MPVAERAGAIRALAADVLDWALPADLVAVEGLAFDARSTSATERAHLWWLVVHGIARTGTPLVVPTATQVKKWATGRGVGNKTVVGIAAGRMWPDVEIRDDNEADALVLATIGAQLLDGPLPCDVTAYRREVAGKLSISSPSAA
jgi:crossover junction endodeoxyribonuclease RuvC